jgi:hypothetical protein
VATGRSGASDTEIFNMGLLPQDTYALEFHDWRYLDDGIIDPGGVRSSDYPDRVCFDFTLN